MLAYGASDVLGGGVGQVISMYYLTFLLYVVQLSPMQAGLVTGIGRVWDGITDPLMGVVVDRTKSRFGACRFWMLVGVIPIFAAYFMLWHFFGIPGNTGRFVYYIFVYMFWSTALTVVLIPYESLLPRIVSSYKERTDFSSVRMIFSGVACVVSTYIYEWLVPVRTENGLTPAFIPNFTMLGIVLGLMFSLPLLVTVFGVKENPLKKDRPPLTLRLVYKDYTEIFKSRIFRKYFFIGLCGTMVGSAVNASMVIFVYLMYGNVSDFFLGFTLVFLVINLKGAAEIAFFVPNVVMMKKYNKHRPYLVDLPLIMIACAMILFITSSTPAWFMLIAMGILGMGVSCLGFVPMTLLPDLSDVDELMYGKRREGVNAGLTTLGKKLVSGLSITLFGFILEIFGLDNKSASPDAATPGAIFAIKLMFGVLPIAICIVMIVLSRFYNLDAESHGIIKRLIAEKYEKGLSGATEKEKKLCEKITGVRFEKMWVAHEDRTVSNF
jgi:oligogalacturonide transporter